MAPTNTAIECVCGRVGRYEESRTVGESPDKAANASGTNNVFTAWMVLTQFKGIRRKMVSDGILWDGVNQCAPTETRQ